LSDHKTLYQRQAQRYHDLVSREDYLDKLLPAILAVDPLDGKTIIELGAGTGRISCQIAPYAKRLISCDNSLHMLLYGKAILSRSGLRNWHLSLATHIALPFADRSADVVVSGWSFCHAAIDAGEGWRESLETALLEAARILQPGGTLILIESLGTGYERPQRPDVLVDYLDHLDQNGFMSTWIRTDYQFKDLSEAKALTSFFFGEEILPKWSGEKGVIVPECTGLWWKQFG
jgi:ubiquinone/menaquinone biosynthesis C-methylase UbiE